MSKDANINVIETASGLVSRLANDIIQLAVKSVSHHGMFTMALSGGSTPKPVYEMLGKAPLKYEMPWKKTFFFFGDERCVPHTSEESNFRMVNEALFKPVPVRSDNFFRLELQDEDPAEAALIYEEEIQEFFELEPGEFPRFDLVLLGLGDDGHTASLFPGTKALNEKERICVENFVPKFDTHRITLTYPTINNAGQVIFAVSGKGKAGVIAEILCGKEKDSYPAQRIQPKSGDLRWYLDRDAASQLDSAACMT